MQQFSKIMVRRLFLICHRVMNYRHDIHEGAREMSAVVNYMTDTPTKPGTDVFGWGEDYSVAAIRFDDTSLGRLIKELVAFADKGTVNFPRNVADMTNDEIMAMFIEHEYARRENLYATLLAGGDAKAEELTAFKADFCDEHGSLVDIRKVPREHMYVLVAGFHRMSFAYDQAHKEAVAKGLKWTDLIPIIPSSFLSASELTMWEAKINAQGEQQIRQTRLDLIKLAKTSFEQFDNEQDFRRKIGDMMGVNKRTKSGQSEDDDVKAVAINDAGSNGRFAYCMAKLIRKFPRIPIWENLTCSKDDTDYVALKDLTIQTKDWYACVPLILLFTDRTELQKYCNKYSTNPNFPKKAGEVLASGQAWGEEEVAKWWETRKKGRNNGVLPTSLEAAPASYNTDRLKNWEETHATDLVKMVARAAKADPATSPDFQFLLNNAEVLNNVTDIAQKRPQYIGLVDEITKLVAVADDMKPNPLDVREILKTAIQEIRSTIDKANNPVEEAVAAAPAGGKGKATKK